MCARVHLCVCVCEKERRMLTFFGRCCGIVVGDESVEFERIKDWGQHRLGRGHHTDVKLSIGGSVPSGAVDTAISQVCCVVQERLVGVEVDVELTELGILEVSEVQKRHELAGRLVLPRDVEHCAIWGCCDGILENSRGQPEARFLLDGR